MRKTLIDLAVRLSFIYWASSYSRTLRTRTLSVLMQQRLDYHQVDLELEALRWLTLHVYDTDSVAVGLQAMGGINPYSTLATRLVASGDFYDVKFENMITTGTTTTPTPAETARIARSIIFLTASRRRIDVPASVLSALRDSRFPDMQLLSQTLHGTGNLDAEGFRATQRSSSLTSTALLVFRYREFNGDARNILSILRCIRPDQVPRHNWNNIQRQLSYLYTLVWRSDGLRRSSPCLRKHSQCDALCVASTAAGLMLYAPLPIRGQNRAGLARLIIPLLDVETKQRPPSIDELPFLLHFFASRWFLPLSRNCQVSTHVLIAKMLLPESISPHITNDPQYAAALLNLLRAAQCHPGLADIGLALQDDAVWRVTATLTALLVDTQDLGSQQSPIETYQGYWSAYQADPVLYLSRASTLTGSKIPLLRMLFHRPHSSLEPGPQNIWQGLLSMAHSVDRFSRLWILIHYVARSLCALTRQGEDVTDISNEFLDGTPFQDLTLRLSRWPIDGINPLSRRRRRGEQVLRHCLELRPSRRLEWYRLMAPFVVIPDTTLRGAAPSREESQPEEV